MIWYFILGTAAELIKVYPVILLARNRGIKVVLVSSGQSPINLQKQLTDFGDEFSLMTPVFSENDLRNAHSALRWFLKALCVSKGKLKSNLKIGKKSLFLVHGDTLTTVVGARWAKRLELPLVHIEAGFRSGRILSPFPEEINRRLAARWADYHFAPTDATADNLKRENRKGVIVSTGFNILYDTLQLPLVSQDNLQIPPRFVLANIHRFENINSRARLGFIIDIIFQAQKLFPVLFVVHPQTAQKLQASPDLAQKMKQSGVQVIDRLPFSQFLNLMRRSEFLLTDGGSNQEECYYIEKPCLILRQVTEHQEGLNGLCVLCPFDQNIAEGFLRGYRNLKSNLIAPKSTPSQTIVETLLRDFA